MAGDRTIIRTEFEGDGTLPAGLNVALNFISGPDRGKVHRINKRKTVLGRGMGDVPLSDAAASKQHCELLFEGGQLSLRDLESTNGTLLNGGRVWEALINNLDEITIGQTVIQVQIAQEAASASFADLEQVREGREVSGDITNVQPERAGQDPLEGPLPEGVKAGLQVVEGADTGLRYLVKKRGTLIGRAGADIALQDMDVSRKHASIEFMSKDRVILKDLRSRNGTFLNQRWTSVGNLKHGDVIKVGNTSINFYLSAGEDEG